MGVSVGAFHEAKYMCALVMCIHGRSVDVPKVMFFALKEILC